MMKPTLVAAVLLTAVLTCTVAGSEEENVLRTWAWGGRDYQVALLGPAWKYGHLPEQALVLRWRAANGPRWHIAQRISDVLMEDEVRMPGRGALDLDALVFAQPGGSADFLSVAQIVKNPPALRILLSHALRKGGSKYIRDPNGRLIGIKFTYCQWHVGLSPGPDLGGHIYTARNVGWHQAEERFRRGPVYIDTESEEQASLLDVLLTVASEYYLHFRRAYDEKACTTTCIYRPVGLLGRKTPLGLRSAKRVKAVIKYVQPGDGEWEPRLVEFELRALDDH